MFSQKLNRLGVLFVVLDGFLETQEEVPGKGLLFLIYDGLSQWGDGLGKQVRILNDAFWTLTRWLPSSASCEHLWSACSQSIALHLDDIPVFGGVIQEPNANLKPVLDCLRDAGLTLNPKKRRFLQHSVTFLGHTASSNGIAVTDDRAQRVRTWSTPTNQTELRGSQAGSPTWNTAQVPSPMKQGPISDGEGALTYKLPRPQRTTAYPVGNRSPQQDPAKDHHRLDMKGRGKVIIRTG
ncbi:RNA directed DNA polymerase (reverse transcriptase) [Echinococcus multilocularis]|uniref:RNA directed DNA polymerase (Reverse transcriptase) n=1 Tax=Echinococcus multilocularis TaxID=6211 RepID=A0A0S4MNU8_ECHMU|nr:RNA directed DNA polymerase (reverse transcriptase) [Echinococcus multilocularis]